MSTLHGWAGRILFVDLTEGRWWSEPTWEHVPRRIGALGLGLQLVWDRVPARTGGLDPANLLFLGVGPLTGTWAPSAGRAVGVTISPASHPVEHVVQSGLGGQWPAELKWAGWDGIAVLGRSPRPVYLLVVDEHVEIRDAEGIWGLDTHRAQAAMRADAGQPRAKGLVIGMAGEKLARNASLIHGTGHALGQGGLGAVAGSKQLKGLLVRGTGRATTAIPLADYRPRLRELRRNLCYFQSGVPYSESTSSRWRAREGLSWAGGDEVVPMGDLDWDDLSTQALRHCGSEVYMGGLMLPWHVKNTGCTGCTFACFSLWRGEGLPEGIPAVTEAHCVQSQAGFFRRVRDGVVVAASSRASAMVSKQLADLHGVNAYDLRMLLPLLLQARYGADGSYRQQLPRRLHTELLALPWGDLDDGGDGLPFWMAVFQAMADASGPDDDGLGGLLLCGLPRAAERLGMFDDVWTGAHGQYEGYEGLRIRYGAHGNRSHYGPMRFGYPAGLHWVIWNRDPNRHEHNGLAMASGLTWDQKQRVTELLFGDRDLLDDPNHVWGAGPPTASRVELARFLAVRSMLKDSLTVCDFIFPNYVSPDPQREHAGDLGVEAELYRAVTGDEVDADTLDLRAEALVDLYRALTVREWDTPDLRGGEAWGYRGHDNLAAWYFGEGRLDRDEFEEAKGLLYARMGWDVVTGGVTRAKLEELDQAEVADGLDVLGLLPD